jgi:DNA-binding GntR family transcriptional regulator
MELDQAKSTLAEQAFRQVMDMIRQGELRPGDVVNELELAKQLGMSRGPIREAIRKLEGRKIITREAFQRARVSTLDGRRIQEIFELREALEGMACRLATRNMSDEELGQLASSTAVMDPKQTSFVTTDSPQNFHTVLVKASGNERIQALLSQEVYDIVRFYRWNSRPAPSLAGGQSHDHWQIARAMLARDEDLAESLMRAHVRRVRSLILS